MSGEVPRELLNFIHEGEKFLVAGHAEPDGDCVGSQFALASALRRMGKDAVLCSAGPFRRDEVKHLESLFAAAPKTEGGERLIVLDCTSLDRTGDLLPYIKGLPAAVIDHHGAAANRAPDESGKTLWYVDANAPSTTFLVRKLILALGLEPNREEAEHLFFGLCTDTGYFRHVDSGGAETFEAAAALIRAGANPKDSYSAMYGGRSLDSRRLIGRMLLKAESHFNGKLIVSFEEYDDILRFGRENRDSDSLYQLFQSVGGVEAIAIIRQEKPGTCTVGLRSRSAVDVGRVAEFFGGGGHKNAAGFTLDGTIAGLKPKILKAFGDILID